jgi:hypothetical protein
MVGLGGIGVSDAVGCGVLVANGVGCKLHAVRRATAIHVKSFKPRRKSGMGLLLSSSFDMTRHLS